MTFSNWVHLDFKLIKRETEKAFWFHLEDDRFLWVPKSMIESPEDYEAGDEDGTVSVSEWFASQEGLNEE